MASALQIVRHFHPDVTTVKDAKSSIDIEVLPRDTSTATVKNHRECAMAVACKRRFHLDGIIISVGRAYLIKGKTATRFRLPESVSREITSFDRKAGFAPGVYQLQKPEPSHRISTGGHGLHRKRNGGDKRFRHITQNIRTNLSEMKD